MTLRLFDTAARELREFVPVRPGHVGMYVCGATVQSPPHIGHLRSAIAFDVLARWLKRSGLSVTLIRNVTDIDDKILDKAEAAGMPWWAWAAVNERLFTAAYDALGVTPPSYEPHATAHVPDMVALMTELVESGHAYVTSPGNVYFDVQSWPSYGSLTHQRAVDLTASAGAVSEGDKKDPRDFALWKAPRAGEPETASWETPYGRGRPGWHLECSAMARRYLGRTFDIHGGGLDLRFPHHENERAQSQAAGDDFARCWLHSAWVTQGGEKMSKSLGNGLAVEQVLATTSPAVLRLALAGVHYRSMIEWSLQTLNEARAVWDRFRGFVARAAERSGVIPVAEVAAAELPVPVVAAFDDDLNVPVVLAEANERLRAGNTALMSGDDAVAREHALVLRATLDVLGLDPGAPRWAETGEGPATRVLGRLVKMRLDDRAEARARHDYAKADEIRADLAAAGVQVADRAEGASWTFTAEDRAATDQSPAAAAATQKERN